MASQMQPSTSSTTTIQSTIYQELMKLIPSSDNQLNEISPPQLSTSGRLTNILDTGILSRAAMDQQSQSYQGGYDLGSNDVVFLNVITKEAGIARAVLNPADGVFGVGIERAQDHEWIQSICDQEEIEKIFQEKVASGPQPIPDYFHPLIKEKALEEHLSQNPKFLDELETRVNNLVVFVLDIPTSGSDKLDDPLGCHDATRSMVSSENITTIIASRDLKDTSEMANIISKKIKPVIFVQQKEQEITYTYEKTSALGTEKKSFKVMIKAPDFQEAMKNIYRTSSFSQERPMFIHVTRF